jgi:5-methylcytosine-specific restriction enzyme A
MTSRLEFTTATKRAAFARSNGKCELCGMVFGAKKKEYDHRLPCALGGDNSLANCMVICTPCHAEKTAKHDVPRIRKADRQRNHDINAARRKTPIQSRGFDHKPKREPKPTLPPRELYR